MRKIKDTPIIGKIFIIIGFVCVFVVGLSVFSSSQMADIDQGYSTTYERGMTAGVALTRANRRFVGARSAIADILIANTEAGNAAAMARLTEAKKQFADYMAKAKTADPALSDDLEVLNRAVQGVLVGKCSRAVELGMSATDPSEVATSQTEYLANCADAFDPVEKKLADFSSAIYVKADATMVELKAKTRSTILTTYGAAGLGLLLTVLSVFVAVRAWITVPLNNLATNMTRLAKQDYNITLEGIDNKDELGAMARAVAVFKEQGETLIHNNEAAEKTRVLTEAERAADLARRADVLAKQEEVVANLGAGLHHLSEGNLTFRFEKPFTAEYEKLRLDFNAAMEKLCGALGKVMQNTVTMRAGAGEISNASDNMSRRTEQQAANLEETAAALNEITAAVQRTAEGASHARTFVATTKETAETSGEIVRNAVANMDNIEKSSNQIGQIIGVIDEIAFQTNLLALNAGVEAARAGDAGRGFAVVAQEVRGLAQRSADAAKEIKTLISNSQMQVEQGVELVARTGEALQKIATQVSEINGIVSDIAASTTEQATGLNQIATAINQMDGIVQQNAAMVQESTAASHNLTDEAEELTVLVGRFQTGAQVQAASFSAKPQAKSAPARAGTSASQRPVAALRTTGHGGAVAKPRAAQAPVEDTWSDF